jgi:hypothetical protein
MNHAATTRLALAAVALVLAGCQDPYQREQRQTAPTPATSVSGDAERAGPRAPDVPPVPEAQASSAHGAARTFAGRWINWDWRTLPAHQRELARLGTGRLADELRANAKTSAANASLARDQPSSRGSIVAVDLHAEHAKASAVIVTREQTYTAGHADLGGQHHHVYRALLTRGIRGWEVSAWTPLP